AGDTREITMRWRERLLFEAGGSGRPPVLVDGDGAVATSPVEMLLVAAATCAASDVVLILEKQRVVLGALEVALRGTRREEQPRRRSEEHTSELQSRGHLVCRLLLEKKMRQHD